ncbi:unnamed protein product [Mytilus edulis]|uniref:FLYWCH-type domain-containing protein n=1 Tax=Mytilus edulis TaxID=6550 RepID=A0A8S3V758_MYTED|nr:unnamed protein product [Mytilus edulis]
MANAQVAGYRYCVKTRKQGRDGELVYWKCTEMDCPGTVNTTDNLVTRFPKDHNHPPSHADIKAKPFLSHLSEKARTCLDPLPTLYYPCKSSLYRQRNSELPRQPLTRQDIDLQGEWRETSTGQNFELSEDGDTILVFGTSDNLRHLSQANTIIAKELFKLVHFNDYVTEQWVDREPERWNHFSTVGTRTTNHLEGWHHKLNNQLNKDHPNLFLIIQKLQNTQAATEIRLIQYAAGGKRKTCKLKYRNINNTMTQLKERLQQGQINVYQYTDAVSHLLKLG